MPALQSNEAMPPRNAPGFSSWDCHICGISENAGWRARCRICDAYPKPGARRPLGGSAKGKGGKGGDDARKGHGKGSGAGGKCGTGGKGGDSVGAYATRQLQVQRSQQAQAAHRASERELADARRRNTTLLEDNQRLQQELADAKRKQQGTEDDDEMDTNEYSEEDRKTRMEKIKGSLPYLEEHFGVDSTIYQEAVDELDVHNRALREAKPYRTHRTILERKVDKLRKLQERDKERLSELQEAADEIKAKIEATTSTIGDRDREIEAAELELKELVLRAVGEDAAGPQAPTVDPAAGWHSVIQTVGHLARQPGVPEHFTVQLDGLFGQLQQMVAVLSSHAAAVGAAPGPAATSPSGAGAQADDDGNRTLSGGGDEPRQGRRLAWAQRKQTEAISKFTDAYRKELHQRQQQQQQQPQQQQLQQQQCQQPPQQNKHTDIGSGTTGESSPPLLPAPASTHTTSTTAEERSDVPRLTEPEAPTTETAAAAASGTPGAETTATAAAAGPSAASFTAPPVLDPAASTEFEDFESDITGTLSETERDNMDIETVVSKVPADQKASVRAILEVRRARTARRTQRLKNPATEVASSRAPKRK